MTDVEVPSYEAPIKASGRGQERGAKEPAASARKSPKPMSMASALNVPRNVDDIPVGRGAGAALSQDQDSPGGEYDHEDVDSQYGRYGDDDSAGYEPSPKSNRSTGRANAKGAATSARAAPPPADEIDRPIKPKNNGSLSARGEGVKEKERDPPAKPANAPTFNSRDHPLAGVPNTGELPEPEELDAKSRCD